MWKVFLVEDEILVRANLKSMIDWEKHNFTICGECSDGVEAVALLTKEKPDIIITDVKMKRMNGDELIDYVHNHYPDIKTVIISSYSDFNYVRNALKSQAVDYLLKYDLNSKMLLECLKKCTEMIEQNKENPHSDMDINELKRRFILNLIVGMYTDKQDIICNYIHNLGIKLADKNCVAIIMTVISKKNEFESNFLKERLLMESSVCNIVQEILQEKFNGICCHLEQQRYIVLMSFEHITSWSKIVYLIREFMSTASFCLKKFLNCKVRLSAGYACTLNNIADSYDKAVEQLNLNFTKTSDFIIYNDGFDEVVNAAENQILKLNNEEEKELNLAIEQVDEEKAISVMNGIYDRIRQSGIQLSNCIILYHELYALFIRYGKRNHIQMEELFYNRDFLDDKLIQMDVAMQEIEDYFDGIRKDLFLKLRENGVSEYSKHIEKALNIIHTRYSSQLTLNEVAEEIGLNPSYLSWLFKTEVKTGFSEYLNGYRLEKAKRMLDDNLYHIKEIVEECGFGGYSYFFNLFKKRYHVTPKKYTKGVIQQKDELDRADN